MDVNWKRLAGAVAPTIATTLGGPLAGLGVRALSAALFAGDETKGEREVGGALLAASPEVLAQVKAADQAFAVRMRELDIRLDELAVQDRESARKREATVGGYAVPALGAMILVGFFATVGWVLSGQVALSGEAGAVIGTLIGYVSAKAEQVVAYYFGSSAGSKAKDAVIGTLNGRRA